VVLRRPSKRAADGDSPYGGLRRLALDAVASGLAPPAASHPHVWGVVIDIPQGSEWVTIAALGDGTTSMYTSVGGATLGLGGHELVRTASEQLLQVIEAEVLPFLDPEPGTHPPAGFVRFHVLGADDLAGMDVPAPVFWGERPSGRNLVNAAQHLIHTISAASPAPG